MGGIDDRVGGQRPTWDSPATLASAITPADGADNAGGPFRALYVGTTGNVRVTMRDATDLTSAGTVTFNSVPVGILPVAVSRVWATNTTASNIVGLK